MNLEGLTIFPSGQGLVFIYGDRGSDTRISTLFTAFFNPKNKLFYELNQFVFDLPKPKKYKRNIADLTLKLDGSLWSAATSDPGNEGPFSTFISEAGYVYHKESIGSISKNETYNIDISRIPAGKYLVTIKNGKTYTTPQKLIIL